MCWMSSYVKSRPNHRIHQENSNIEQNNESLSDTEGQEIQQEDTPTEKAVQEVISFIKENSLSKNQIDRLATALGENASIRIYNETDRIKGFYKDIEETSTLDCVNYIRNKPGDVVRYLCSASNMDYERIDQNQVIFTLYSRGTFGKFEKFELYRSLIVF